MKMLFCFFIVIFLSVESSFSQDSTTNVFHLNKLQPEGVLLDKGWKFQSGDNPYYSKADYDDKSWQSINPTLDIHKLPVLWKNNIVWFRLHISLDVLLNKQALALLIEQTGASEIYLNGQLLKRFGRISNNEKQVIAATPPNHQFIGLQYSSSGEYVLAIRFAVQKGLPYVVFAGWPNTALSIHLMDMEAVTYSASNDSTYLQHIRTGLYFILTVLHLALFCFYPAQKANLYFFMFSLLFTCLSFLDTFDHTYVEFASTYTYILIAIFSLFLLSLLFFLTAIYKIFEFKKGIVYGLIVCCFISGYVLFFANYYKGYILGLSIFPIVIFLESIRINTLALKANKRGAKIIMSGAIAFVILFTIHWLIVFNILPGGPNWIYGNATFFLSFLSLPMATSIFLALESTFASKSLKEKLNEVQNLSEKAIAQEQEKQQILAGQKQNLEKEVMQRTAELRLQKTELQTTLEELKATQSQLIQSEKMASLGELTAGIAHEIQNPLNFVNNFSEVNTELVDEMQHEMDKGNYEDAKAISNDIKENELKINQHGKRADAIVKGMLQHSQKSSGQKKPTDINKLADEYLRLSYHGLRAKDKTFNATLQTDFDESIGKINIIPQDIGRVILNIINNAFYAVNERSQQQPGNYEPTVSVSTKKIKDKIEIKIADNGNGIPQKNFDKIFQPFFTSKPTGQGTGLGLSLSYDIIKAHRGEIKVNTKEGEGAEFIIQLPVNKE